MTRCHCEHIRHFPTDELDRFPVGQYPRDGHPDGQAEAGQHRAMYVGEVCDECARTCVAEYLLP